MNEISASHLGVSLPPDPCPTCGEVHPICSCGRARLVCPVDEPGEPFAWCEYCEADEQPTAAFGTDRFGEWSNHETWAVVLWLEGDPAKREAIRAQARTETAAKDMPQWLREQVEAQNPLAGQVSLYSALLRAALAFVNYHAIAAHFIREHADSG